MPSRSTGFGLLAGVLLASSYLVLGKLALLISVTPGFASPIFVSAGIAVACAYQYGRRVLPWVFVGSFLLNLKFSYPAGLLPGLFITTVFSLACVVQAGVGGRLLRRLIGSRAPLDEDRQVVRYLLAAPLICLLSCTLSMLTLTLVNGLSKPAAAVSWLTWWLGDTLGLIVAFPIFMALFGLPRSNWRGRRTGIIVPVALTVPILVASFMGVSRMEREEQKHAFDLHAQQWVARVQAHLNEQEFLLEQLDAYLSASESPDPVSRREFEGYLSPSLARFPSIKAIEWAPWLDDTQRSAYIEEQRSFRPDFTLTEVHADGELVPAAQRDHYVPVTYIVPAQGNESAFGLDLLSNPDRAAALMAAMQHGGSVATEPVRLVQEQEQQFGILLLKAVSAGPSAPGVVLTVVRVGEFLSKSMDLVPGMQLRMTDQQTREVIFNELNESAEAYGLEFSVHYGGRVYALQMIPSKSYWHVRPAWGSWVLLVTGIIAVGLLAALMLLKTGYLIRIKHAVLDRTVDLRKERDRNEALALQAEEASLAKSRFLAKISHEMLTPMNGVIGMLNVAAMKPADDKQAHYLEVARQSAGDLLELVRNVLSYTQLTARDLEPDRSVFTISKLVSNLEDDFEKKAAGKELEFASEVDPEVPRALVGDDFRISKVLELLLDNAIKFTEPGGSIRFHISAHEIEGGDFWPRFTLQDSGIGMQQDQVESLFEPFAQADESATRPWRGIGFGLALARKLVDNLGGRIWVESRPGKGSQFHFTAHCTLPG